MSPSQPMSGNRFTTLVSLNAALNAAQNQKEFSAKIVRALRVIELKTQVVGVKLKVRTQIVCF
jgi:hypothetical protein